MVTTLKSTPPHVLLHMTGRRRSSSAASSFLFSALLSYRVFVAAACCWFLVLALCFSAAAGDCVDENDDGSRCLGFRDVCADWSSFCFSSSVVETMIASEDGIKKPDLEVSRNWGPSQPLGFRMSGGGVAACSSLDAMITHVRNGLGRDGEKGGRYSAVSCQAPLVPDDWMRASNGVPLELDGTPTDVDPNGLYVPSSMNVELNPPMLDWGTSGLYMASMATLTVTNVNNDSVLRMYEPFSTDPQFYVYGYEDLVLEPGENVSVTFIFLPRLLGSSSAHLVLQTNFGGFIMQAKGMAVKSPYQILPLVGIDVIMGGGIKRNLSIYNPFDDSLSVEEVAVWISASESTKQPSHVVCRLAPFDEAAELASSSKDWYTVSSTEHGWPMARVRPSEQWVVRPSESNTVVELTLQPPLEGKVFGAICMKLRNCTTDTTKTAVVPIELEVHGRTYYDFSSLVSVTFEHMSSCDQSWSIFSLSLRNGALELLRIVSITEDTRNGQMIFQIKYLKGLILFPDSVTDIALIKYTSSVSEDMSFDNCNIVIETNSSVGTSIMIPCQDLVHASVTHTISAVVAEPAGSFDPLSQEENSANARTVSLGSILEVEGLHDVKPTIMRAVKADDTILRSWKSHGTRAGISVLKDNKLFFPVVQIGSQVSKWITVHNPSLEHAAMQLVLNSEEIIDQCKTANDACEYTFSSRSPEIDSTKTRFGFSLTDEASTEVHLGPLESALLGPVVFRPSNRCMWASMALIRNNLTGMEWLPLQAHGGWQSVALLEGSEPVWKLEFNLGSNVHNKSALSQSKITVALCSQQLSKEIYVKNTGDLPLQVKKVKVSGADCGLDGFSADNCKGFSLAPGESIRMLVSFRADFCSAMVQRDLELTMTTGIFVIPMTANITVCMIEQCRKSYFRFIHWKVSILFFGIVSLVLVVLVRNVSHSLTVSTEDHYMKIDNRKSTINKTVKPSFLQHSNKTCRPARENNKVGGDLSDKCPASVRDSPKRTDDKNHPYDQPNKASTPSACTAKPVEDRGSRESPQRSGDLTIRVARDKGRRRKRKAGAAGLAAKFEVSSSHSGNSTPSSPLSPSSTPKQGWPFSGPPAELKHENKPENGSDVESRASSTEKHCKNNWLRTAKEQPPPSSATSGSLLPSTTVLTPVWGSPVLAVSSPIAPHARAPGSNLTKDKAVKRDESIAPKKEFTYDIWGDHFSGHLLGKAREISSFKSFDESEGASNSFFAREPQALMMKSSSAPSVSRGLGSLPSDVMSGYGIN